MQIFIYIKFRYYDNVVALLLYILYFSNDDYLSFDDVRSAIERTSSNQGNDAILRYQGTLKANTSGIARLANLPDNLIAMI